MATPSRSSFAPVRLLIQKLPSWRTHQTGTVYGRPSRRSVDIWPISRLLVEKYVAPADPRREVAIEAFLANMKTEHRLLLELVPEVRRAIDMRIYRGKRADREYQERKSSSDHAADGSEPSGS